MKRAVLSYGAHRFILGGPFCLLGRDPDCSIVLDHPSISRKHAVIINSGSRHVILDYKSSNGLFVNDEPVFRSLLTNGDRIRLGDETLEFNLQSHFKFGPEIDIRTYEGLIVSRDFVTVLDEALAQVTVESRTPFSSFFALRESLVQSSSLHDLVAGGLNNIVEALEAQRGFVALFDDEVGEMDIRAAVGMEPDLVPGNVFYMLMMQRAFAQCQVVVTTDALTEYFYQEPRLIFLGIGSALCAPIVRLGTAIGILYLDRSMVCPAFSSFHERLVALCAHRLSLYLEDRLLEERVAENLRAMEIIVTRIGTKGASIRCEICGDPIQGSSVEDLVLCTECHTIHHRECWAYNGGCPIYGCDSKGMKTLTDI